MGTHRYIRRKASLESVSTPAPNPFKTRPFGKGFQPRQAELPETNLLQTRPVSPPHQVSSEQQEMPDLQTQLESAERLGYNAANIPVSAPTIAPPIQAKLAIGQPNDQYEQEADSVAAKVVEQINSPTNQQATQGQTVQRQDVPKEEEEQPVQAKLESGTIQRDEMPAPEEEEEEQPVQAKLESGTIQREDMPAPEEEEEEQPVQAKLESGTIQREDMPAPEEEEEEQPVQAKLESGTIQREDMPPPEEEEEQPVQAKLMVQRKPAEGGMAATPDLEESIESARGGGQAIADNIREPMEQAMGADLSGVRIHTDAQSDQLNRSIQARAFTTGQDVFFRQGEYDPGSRQGQELMAHEFTHVLQQNPSVMQRKIQRQDTGEIPGRGVSTEFGEYWVVPDDTVTSYAVEGEQITESEFAQLEATWEALKSGSGNIQITEIDSAGTAHGGFKDKILEQFGKLLSRPIGRRLVMDLVNGSQTVTIQPSSHRLIATTGQFTNDAFEINNPGGTRRAGSGSSCVIEIDADLQDDSIKAYDAVGNEIDSPVFIVLGHELIHAQHITTGEVRGTVNSGGRPVLDPASDPAYGIAEEEDTIATGSLTENGLRNEHGIDERYGHDAEDKRP
ncbi:MAG TPA: hypothetical protein DCL61_29370 [Cyanobacteria bacterium UBA12227]|nr:hypothetical protein [Cyanobacteria bacterium UBA12227]